MGRARGYTGHILFALVAKLLFLLCPSVSDGVGKIMVFWLSFKTRVADPDPDPQVSSFF